MTTTTTATLTRLDSTLETPLLPVRRKFRRDAHAPEAARNFTADALAACGVDTDTIDTAKLLISEAVTNAYRYADRGQIKVAIVVGDKHIRIDVTDAGRSRADRALDSGFDEDSEHGRGWFIIAALAADCGIERIGGGNGNKTWFIIDRALGGASA